MLPRTEPESGSGSVLVIGMLAAVTITATLAATSVGLLGTRSRASAAADAAALAAADTLSGRYAGFPCQNAERVVAAHGAILSACDLDGLVASVSASVPTSLLSVTSRATAGPP